MNTAQPTLSKVKAIPFDEHDGRGYGWLVFWSDNAFHEPIRVINYRRSEHHPWRERIDIEGDPTLNPSQAGEFMLAMNLAITLLQSLTVKNAETILVNDNDATAQDTTP